MSISIFKRSLIDFGMDRSDLEHLFTSHTNLTTIQGYKLRRKKRFPFQIRFTTVDFTRPPLHVTRRMLMSSKKHFSAFVNYKRLGTLIDKVHILKTGVRNKKRNQVNIVDSPHAFLLFSLSIPRNYSVHLNDFEFEQLLNWNLKQTREWLQNL